MTPLRTVFALTAITLPCVLVYVDLRPYQEARASLAERMPLTLVEASLTVAEADAGRLVACLRSKDEESEYRRCLLDYTNKLQGVYALTAASLLTGRWLEMHADQEMLDAALGAVARVREVIRQEKSWSYDPIQDLRKAHDQSVLLRTYNGRLNTIDLYVYDKAAVDKAEVTILSGQIVGQQRSALGKTLGVGTLEAAHQASQP